MESPARRGSLKRLREDTGPLYVVMAGRLMTNIGFFMVIPFLTFYLTEHKGMTGFQIGLLFAILQFTRRVLGVLAGWLSDRFGAAPILSAGLALEAVAYLWLSLIHISEPTRLGM